MKEEKKHILIIDDEEGIREPLKEYFYLKYKGLNKKLINISCEASPRLQEICRHPTLFRL